MPKIILLDVDGVVCTRRSHLAYGKEGGMWNDWDPLACAAIKRACMRGAKIVVSSTWRKNQNDLFPQLEKYGLMEHLYNYPNAQDWMTPITGASRGEEIHCWLERHKDIQDYRILDDDSDMMEYQLPKFIHTHGEEGMTSANIKQLLNWTGALKS